MDKAMENKKREASTSDIPHDLEAERSVLASIMLDNEVLAEVAEWLQAEDFYRRSHRILYTCFADLLLRQHQPVDPTSVHGWLCDRGYEAEVGGIAGLSALLDSYALPSNVVVYAQRVHHLSRLRQCLQLFRDMVKECQQGTVTADTILHQAEERILKLIGNPWERQVEPIGIIAERELEKLRQRLKEGEKISGIPSGFADLDEKTQGFQAGDMIVLAARPSMGKTTFALEMASYMSLALGKKVAFFSLEMGREALVMRLLSMWAHLGSQVWRQGKVSAKELEALRQAVETFRQTGLYIDDTPGLSVGELRLRLLRLRSRTGVDVVFVDYLQMLRGSTRSREENRQMEVSEISRQLKTIAAELKVPVIALSQLSRAPELREDHRPRLSDLRESGTIEQDADLVMFLYREEFYRPTDENDGQVEVIIAKHRNGPTGTVPLIFHKNIARFYGVWREEDDLS